MSIIERLNYENSRVVNIELMDDKRTVEFEEGCDMYFTLNLDKQEVAEFIKEMQDLHSQMV